MNYQQALIDQPNTRDLLEYQLDKIKVIVNSDGAINMPALINSLLAHGSAEKTIGLILNFGNGNSETILATDLNLLSNRLYEWISLQRNQHNTTGKFDGTIMQLLNKES